ARSVDGDTEIQIAKPFVNGREVELVTEVLQSGRLSLGPMLHRFEQAFAQFVGAEHAIAVSSGTAGLHVACIGAGFGPGDEVITSPFSFIASANVIRYCGARLCLPTSTPTPSTLPQLRSRLRSRPTRAVCSR